jgi:hypothetical protein
MSWTAQHVTTLRSDVQAYLSEVFRVLMPGGAGVAQLLPRGRWLRWHHKNQRLSVVIGLVSCNHHLSIGSMYGIYSNIGGILMVNVTIYTIHGSYGLDKISLYCIVMECYTSIARYVKSKRSWSIWVHMVSCDQPLCGDMQHKLPPCRVIHVILGAQPLNVEQNSMDTIQLESHWSEGKEGSSIWDLKGWILHRKMVNFMGVDQICW